MLKLLYPLPTHYPVTFAFGENPDWYIKQFGYPHNGIDIACPDGTPVLACDDGTVVYADNTPDADGAGVFLGHSWGQSEYWHLSSLSVKLGDIVKKGDRLGYSGHSGFATGPHLHFGIKVTADQPAGMNGWSDPQKYLDNVTPIITTPETPFKTYTVVYGDTLWSLAEKFYGSGSDYPKIFAANRDILEEPDIILPGQVLKIP